MAQAILASFVGDRDGGNLVGRRASNAVSPRAVLCAMDLGIAGHGENPGGEQAAQIAIALLPDAAKLVPPFECRPGTSPIQAEKLRAERNAWDQGTLATRAVASAGPMPGMAAGPSHRIGASQDPAVELENLRLQGQPLAAEGGETRPCHFGYPVIASIRDDFE